MSIMTKKDKRLTILSELEEFAFVDDLLPMQLFITTHPFNRGCWKKIQKIRNS